MSDGACKGVGLMRALCGLVEVWRFSCSSGLKSTLPFYSDTPTEQEHSSDVLAFA